MQIDPTVLLTLRRGITDGHWELEQLDEPSHGWLLQKEEWDKRNPLTPFPAKPPRNLLRDNPTPTGVEIISPKDLPPETCGRPGIPSRGPSLPLQGPSHPTPPLRHSVDHDRLQHQVPSADGQDHGDKAHLGTEGEHRPSLHGTVLDW